MEGGLPYEKALEARLDVMKPSRQDIDAFLRQHPPRLSPRASPPRRRRPYVTLHPISASDQPPPPPRALAADVATVLDSLRRRGVQAFLVSGGFRQARRAQRSTHPPTPRRAQPRLLTLPTPVRPQLIAPIAREVGLDPESHVFANTLFFADDGSFTGFDSKEPTSRSGGKALVVQQCVAARGWGCSLVGKPTSGPA